MNVKNTDSICYTMRLLVFLQQWNVKKVPKINKKSWYWSRKYWYLLNELRNFKGIFRNDVAYYNIKSHKNQGFTFSLENTFLEKPQPHTSPIPPPPPNSHFSAKLKIGTKKQWHSTFKANIIFWSYPILLDFHDLGQIFCNWLQMNSTM